MICFFPKFFDFFLKNVFNFFSDCERRALQLTSRDFGFHWLAFWGLMTVAGGCGQAYSQQAHASDDDKLSPIEWFVFMISYTLATAVLAAGFVYIGACMRLLTIRLIVLQQAIARKPEINAMVDIFLKYI